MTARAARFGAAFAALYAAHTVADHWVQTGCQSAAKGLPGWPGRRACGAHVATYTATAAVALAAVAGVTRMPLRPGRVATGLVVSAATHYLTDRREPLRRMAALTGHSGLADLRVMRPAGPDSWGPGTGLYVLDQSWHIGWLFVAALIIA